MVFSGEGVWCRNIGHKGVKWYLFAYLRYLFAYHKIDLVIVSTEPLKLIRPALPAELAN